MTASAEETRRQLDKISDAAVKLLESGRSNRVIVVREGKVVDLDITEALAMKRPFNKELYDIALKISI